MQALAFFQWCNYALKTEQDEIEPVVINVDESSLAFHWTGLVGTVSKTASAAADKANLQDRRARATYICALTHDAAVQKLLPQVLLGNSRSFPVYVAEHAEALCPRLVIWRAKSAWCTHLLMRRYLRLLADCLGPVVASRRVCVLLDLAPCHLHDSLFVLAHSLGLRLIYVPAGMTSCLQPCDAHFFARFKFLLQEKWRQKKAGAPGGRLTLLMWLEAVAMTIDSLTSQRWRHAFESTGILCQQESVSNALLQKMRWGVKPHVSAVMPDENVAQLLFPAKWQGNPAKYIAWDPHAIRTLD